MVRYSHSSYTHRACIATVLWTLPLALTADHHSLQELGTHTHTVLIRPLAQEHTASYPHSQCNSYTAMLTMMMATIATIASIMATAMTAMIHGGNPSTPPCSVTTISPEGWRTLPPNLITRKPLPNCRGGNVGG